MSVITKDLGAVSAYGLALEAGYEGTEQEYAELLASYGTVAQEAGESAQEAEAAKTAAQTAATEAQASAQNAEQSRIGARTYATSAGNANSSAVQASENAEAARDAAIAAKNGAVNAVDGFAAGAQQALDSVNEAGANWKSLAEKQAGNSEAWAVGQRGGVDVPTTDATYHNNAKYYAEQAATDRTTAQTAATNAGQSATAAAESASQAAESARTLTIDPTLTQSGQAADAKVVGEAVDDVKDDFNKITAVTTSSNKCDPSSFVVGLLNSKGTVDTSYTTRLTTDYIDISGAYASIYCHRGEGYADGNALRIALYNNDKSLKQIVVTNTPMILPTDGATFVRASVPNNWNYYFVGFSGEEVKIPFEEYYPNIYKVKESVLPDRITTTDNWLYKFAECDFVGGNVHLSIDDVGSALYDLTANTPASLWDSNFFGQLKTLHETYGICITCNCFSFLNTIEEYDIANVPNTWASEFVSAKDWLKFAFHAKNNTVNYNSDTNLKADYEYFASAIYHMTGDYECIDTGVRLTGFTGTKEQIVETMKTAHGITMLWTADDNRNSYYFDANQTERVNKRGKYIDDFTNLLFIRSMPRLDNRTIDDITPLIAEKPQYGKFVELYCHENLSGSIASGTITRINNALTWFKNNGYKSNFLSLIFA